MKLFDADMIASELDALTGPDRHQIPYDIRHQAMCTCLMAAFTAGYDDLVARCETAIKDAERWRRLTAGPGE